MSTTTTRLEAQRRDHVCGPKCECVKHGPTYYSRDNGEHACTEPSCSVSTQEDEDGGCDCTFVCNGGSLVCDGCSGDAACICECYGDGGDCNGCEECGGNGDEE